MKFEQIFPGVFKIDGRLATKNLVPGFTVYGERTVKIEGEEYRLWDPFRSKLGAAIMLGLKEMPIHPGDSILYLGAANGTTPSHMSDIVGPDGLIYCVEFAPRSMRDLIPVCEKKHNMLPILADARMPLDYKEYVEEQVDCVYEDVAQPDQIRILTMNAKEYSKKNGPALIAVKSQSISATTEKKKIFEEAVIGAEKNFDIVQSMQLEPFEKDHLFLSLILK